MYRHLSRWIRVGTVLVIAGLVLGSCTPRQETSSTNTGQATSAPSSTPSLPDDTSPPVLFGPGFEEGLLRLGVLLPLSGQLAQNGQDVLTGHRAYWQYVNEELGGIRGFEVEVLVGDNEYTLEGNEREFAQMRDDVLAVSSTLGSPITADLLAGAPPDMPIVVGSQVSAWGEQPNAVMNLALSSYRDQIRAGAELVGESSAPAAALIAQEGLYGADCEAGYQAAHDNGDINDSHRILVSRSETDFSEELTAARQAGAQLVFACLVPETLAGLIGGAQAIDYEVAMVASAQSYDSSVPAAVGGDGGEEAGLAAVQDSLSVIGAIDPHAPGTRLYLDNLARAGVIPAEAGWYVFMGYSQAATLHLIIDRALRNGDATRDGLLRAAADLAAIDLGFGGGVSHFGEDGTVVRAESVGTPVSSEQAPFGVESTGIWLQP